MISRLWRAVVTLDRSVVWGVLLALAGLSMLVSAGTALAAGAEASDQLGPMSMHFGGEGQFASILKASFVVAGVTFGALAVANVALGARMIVDAAELREKLLRVAAIAYAAYFGVTAIWQVLHAIGSIPRNSNRFAEMQPVVGPNGFWFVIYFIVATVLALRTMKSSTST